MVHRTHSTIRFSLAALLAVVISGFIHVGVLLLNREQAIQPPDMISGSIRLAQPVKEVIEEQQRKRPQDHKPPEKLPKTFSTRPRNTPDKPRMDLQLPAFSADMHPSISGGIAMPSLDTLGGIGFSLDEVDEAPRIASSVAPRYPLSAQRSHIEGKVVVRILVTAQGKPAELSVHSATPAGVFDEAALDAARRMRFSPGKYDGRAVDTWVLLPFDFELSR